jgi:hypothetical protein
MTQRYDERDEAVFLRQQAEDAKKAMQQTLAAMRETAKTVADAQALTQAYPWPSVGAGALAGFMASALLPSFKGQTDQVQSDAPTPSLPSLAAFVQSSLLGVIRNVVISAMTSAVYANAQAAEPDQDEPAGESLGEGR